MLQLLPLLKAKFSGMPRDVSGCEQEDSSEPLPTVQGKVLKFQFSLPIQTSSQKMHHLCYYCALMNVK